MADSIQILTIREEIKNKIMKQSLNSIVHKTRGTGNTRWILRSAIENYRCVIVYGETKEQSELLKKPTSMKLTKLISKKLLIKS